MFHVILAQAVAHLFTCIYFSNQFVVVLYCVVLYLIFCDVYGL
jgi:hypothetical protein